jgi:hypothetical protein
MDITVLPVPNRNLREFPLFHVSAFFKNCPSARCATAGNSSHSNLMLHLISYHKLSYWIISVIFCLLYLCFICVVFIVLCYLSLYAVLFLLRAIWLFKQHLNKTITEFMWLKSSAAVLMLYKIFCVFTRRRFLGKKPTFRYYLSVPSSGSRGERGKDVRR